MNDRPKLQGERLAFLVVFALIGMNIRVHPLKESRLQLGPGATNAQVDIKTSGGDKDISRTLFETTKLTGTTLSKSRAELRKLPLEYFGYYDDWYDSYQFYSAVEQSHSQIINGLDKPELLALRSYVNAYFEALNDTMPARTSFPVGARVSIMVGVHKPEADTVFQRIQDLLQKLTHLDPLAVNLDISSEPKGADFAIQVGQNSDTNRGLNTNGQIPGVWRGLYTATIKMSGYKPRTFQLDLVDDSRGKLACILVPSDDQTGATTSCAR
jgi:hypothetical protein